MPEDGNCPVPKQNTQNLDQSGNAEVEKRPECMSCKAVAFVTPLLISSYFIYHHHSIEKIKQTSFAVGQAPWRLQVYRIHMCAVVPITLCYFTYANIFQFGIFAPEVKEKPFQEEMRSDMDSFTSGTLKLADWLSKSSADKNEDISDMFTRLKRTFFGQQQPPKSNSKDATEKDNSK